MSDIARKSAEEVTRMAIANVSPGAKATTAEERTAVIQSAIEEATRKLSRKCFDLTEENAELRSLEPDDTKRLADLLELAWGVIANAGGGDWEKESKEWQGAAEKWRDDYHASMKKGKK